MVIFSSDADLHAQVGHHNVCNLKKMQYFLSLESQTHPGVNKSFCSAGRFCCYRMACQASIFFLLPRC